MKKRSGITTKKRILDVASRIFSEYGYAWANMRIIAGAANIGVSSLYLYFNNKEYLILMISWMDDFSDKTMGYVKNIHYPSETISAFIKISINYAKKHPALTLLKGREHRFAFGIVMKREFLKRQRDLIEDIIRHGARSGSFLLGKDKMLPERYR
jgi:AcrR family transcriptional regulator